MEPPRCCLDFLVCRCFEFTHVFLRPQEWKEHLLEKMRYGTWKTDQKECFSLQQSKKKRTGKSYWYQYHFICLCWFFSLVWNYRYVGRYLAPISISTRTVPGVNALAGLKQSVKDPSSMVTFNVELMGLSYGGFVVWDYNKPHGCNGSMCFFRCLMW